jgi:hypothetical protein
MKTTITAIILLFLLSCKSEIKKEINSSTVDTANTISGSVLIKKEEKKPQLINNTLKKYSLNNINVTLIQKRYKNFSEFCNSTIVIMKDSKLIDSLNINSEPVGGGYGVSIPKAINKHLIFTKEGDYDGRTIIINNKGKVSNIIGGENYYDSENELLFTIHQSDLSGLAVFDLKADSLLIEMPGMENTPYSIHKAFENRYFFSCYDPETSATVYFEIKVQEKRIMQVDLDSNQINKQNMLPMWATEYVNCICEQ